MHVKDNNNNDNNNDCCIALYPVNIYKLAALYIINIKIHLTIKNKRKEKYKDYKCIHQYQNDKKVRMKQNQKKNPHKNKKQKREEEAQVL